MTLLAKVFLAMFALHLAPPVIYGEHQKFQFGDLIAIEYPSGGNPSVHTYIHWAVYVGKGKVEGLNEKIDDEDIFHIYGYDISEDPFCVFDTLSEFSGEPKKFNYLDKDSKWNGAYSPISEKEMKEEIMNLYNKCKWWDPALNDCNHVLAYVRYGEKQLGKCN